MVLDAWCFMLGALCVFAEASERWLSVDTRVTGEAHFCKHETRQMRFSASIDFFYRWFNLMLYVSPPQFVIPQMLIGAKCHAKCVLVQKKSLR
jgi:hypothetical protein